MFWPVYLIQLIKKKKIFDLVIVDWLTKIMHYKLIKITIDVPTLAEVIINMVVLHYSLLDLIMINIGFLFPSKLWLLLCHFFNVKQKLSISFYL